MSRGHKQREVAQLWGVSEAAVSRWMAGTEQPDLPSSRAYSLSRLLGLTCDDLIERLGIVGNLPPQPLKPLPESALPGLGTFQIHPHAGRARVLMHLDVPAPVASELVTLMAKIA